jgi:hypothetical protein
VLERFGVPAGQLPVIVNTAIVPCPCGRDAAGILDGSIDPVEVAEVTLVLLPLPPVELVEPAPPGELPVPAELVAVLLGAGVPVEEVPLAEVAFPVVVAAPVGVTLVGAVPAGVVDDVPVLETGALGSVGAAADVPSAPGLEPGVGVTGVAVGSVGSSVVGEPPGG